MIISVNIRDYIEDKIMSVPDAPIPEEEQAIKFEQLLKEKEEEAEKICRQALIGFLVSLGLSKEDAEDVISVRAGFSYYHLPLREKADKIKNERLNAKRRAIREILVQLELEGKKADLESLLDKAIASLKK